MTVRVGHIPFLNCYPLYYGLQQRGVLSGKLDMELVPGVPTELNRKLAAGEIDLAPISSIAYARNHRHLLLSRHVSISSQGAVESIQLVTRRSLTSLRSVALTRQSATSVALLKTLLKLRFGREVSYEELTGSPEEALQEHDAVLLIGDQGLEALHFPLPGAACHDLGLLWQEWTGVPMVYAVWAARVEFACTNGAELLAVEAELVRCMDYGRQHLPQVVESALGRYRFSREELARYFTLLYYDFPSHYQRGLVRFYELAREAGELREVPLLRFIDDYAGSCGNPQGSKEQGSPRGE